MLKIEILEEHIDVYDITVEKNENFYANGILVHNCQEVILPVQPLSDLSDSAGEIAQCVLGAVNWGKIKKTTDFEKPCTLIVRALDALIDYQTYPVLAGELATKNRRPLGVGLINLAYWMAKNGMTYTSPNLELIDEYMEAQTFYLTKASIDLAKEYGPCPLYQQTKYAKGIFLKDTYKRAVDELVPHNPKMNWEALKADVLDYGIRNSSLSALMPSESSSQVSNATNGIEPPRALVSIKQSKDGVLKQVVPEIKRLKNKYELLWDQKSPRGYLSIMAVIQKWVDQSISTNTSYNPKFYPDEKIPMSVMLEDLLLCYKWGIKTLYYFGTNDGAGEVEEKELEKGEVDDEICESCAI